MSEELPKISGYRQLSTDEIGLINAIKASEAQIGELWRQIFALDGIDKRAASIARTDLQTGFMWMARSVAQPEETF
jgi:hypothetical protein